MTSLMTPMRSRRSRRTPHRRQTHWQTTSSQRPNLMSKYNSLSSLPCYVKSTSKQRQQKLKLECAHESWVQWQVLMTWYISQYTADVQRSGF